jgi:hypothetical protein
MIVFLGPLLQRYKRICSFWTTCRQGSIVVPLDPGLDKAAFVAPLLNKEIFVAPLLDKTVFVAPLLDKEVFEAGSSSTTQGSNWSSSTKQCSVCGSPNTVDVIIFTASILDSEAFLARQIVMEPFWLLYETWQHLYLSTVLHVNRQHS